MAKKKASENVKWFALMAKSVRSAWEWASVVAMLDMAAKFPGDMPLMVIFEDGPMLTFPDIKVAGGNEFVEAYHSFPRPAWGFSEDTQSRRDYLAHMGYRDYLQTPEWKATAKRKRQQAGNRCQVCNASGVQLDVHHRTYENRGHELDEDLIVLCHECHGIFESAGKLKAD